MSTLFRLAVCVVAAVALGGCTDLAGTDRTVRPVTAETVFPGDDWTEASPDSQGVDAAGLDEAMRILASICQDHKDGTAHKGATRSVVVRHGRMIWKGSDVDAVQPVYSCTKSFTSSVFGLLVDEGKCTPSTLAADICPTLKEHYPRATLGHFANLTSGYSIPWQAPALIVRPPDFEPGSAIHYNGAGHQLARLFTMLAGEPINDLWRRRLARPIGIPDGTWNWTTVGDVDGKPICGGASGMDISARQMARYGLLYLNKGLWNGKRILSENWVELSTSPQVPPHTRCFQRPDIWYSVLPGRYGYNWWINGIGADGKRLWAHAPDGTYCAQGNRNNYCIIVPEWDLVLVHLDTGHPIEVGLYDKVFAVLSKAVK